MKEVNFNDLMKKMDPNEIEKNFWKNIHLANAQKTVFQGEVMGYGQYDIGVKEERCWLIDNKEDVIMLVPIFESSFSKVSEFKRYLAKIVPFQICSVDRQNNRVICSQKRAVEQMQGRAMRYMRVGGIYEARILEVFIGRVTVMLSGFSFSFTREMLGIAQDLRDVLKERKRIVVEVIEIDPRRNRLRVKPVMGNASKKLDIFKPIKPIQFDIRLQSNR